MVTEFEFATDNVTDISPVRALPGLRKLTCNGSGQGKGILSDLSPLKGLPLTDLLCFSTQVSDLSPLKDMKLTRLMCYDTLVSDLSPLRGMPLTELGCWGTKISGLSPLQGMPLTWLSCGHSRVSELTPLIGMRLTSLHCGHTQVSDLSALKGMKLTEFYCDNANVSDLSPLKGIPLKILWCDHSNVSDLSPLKGMMLNDVSFTPGNIRIGLEFVRQMQSVQTIHIAWDAPRMSPEQFWKKYDAGEFGKPNSSPAVNLTVTQPASPTTSDTPKTPAPTVKPPVASESRLPIPEGAARLKAEQILQDLLKTDLAQAKLPEQKSVLAERLLKQADSTANDPAAKYATLQEALRLAIDIGDAAVLQEAINALAATYVVERH